MLFACSCFGQAFTLKDTAFLGVGRSVPPLTPETGLTHKWLCNEGTGLVARDFKGTIDMFLSTTNPSNVYPQWHSNAFPYSYDLDYSDPNGCSYLTRGNSPDWNFYTNSMWTLSMWVQHTKPFPVSDIEGIWRMSPTINDGPNPICQFKYTTEDVFGQRFEFKLGGATWLHQGGLGNTTWHIFELKTNDFPLGSYVWLTFTRSNALVTLYTNGITVTNETMATQPSVITASPFMMFGTDYFPGAARPWRGLIGEIRIYNGYALSLTEVSNVYRGFFP